MKTLIALFLLLISCESLYAQAETLALIKGHVIENETGIPLEGASIYLQNTTLGTISQNGGVFELRITEGGNYELVASMVGHETQKINVFIETGKNYAYLFKLDIVPVQISQISIEADDLADWRNHLKIFSKIFLGEIGQPDECEITNKERINFKVEKGLLYAECPVPVIVVNHFLGYKLTVELVDFRCDIITKDYFFYHYTKYDEITPKDDKQKNSWEKNREMTYLGSPEHFLVSLKYDKLSEQEFTVYKVGRSRAPGAWRGARIDSLNNLPKTEVKFVPPELNMDNYLLVKYTSGRSSYIKQVVPAFKLDDNGIADHHLPFLSYGYWGKRGLASCLPYDYFPKSLIGIIKPQK